MKISIFLVVCQLLLSCTFEAPKGATSEKESPPPINRELASTPPMGWNSWDSWGWQATEEVVKANADYMEKHLKHLGYQYIVTDMSWFADSLASSFEAFVHDEIPVNPQYNLDSYGRLLPDTVKYPSSAGGMGFKPLADYIHQKGLKFGLHLLRGIPWETVEKDLPIKGTSYKARSIGLPEKGCDWYDGFYGVDMSKPGSQEYYNSVFKLFAEWGVDFVKVDDVVYVDELRAISKAARISGRDMVISVVPGNIPWEILQENTHMARTGHDYWDVWEMLKGAYGVAAAHSKYRKPGFWPDLDMLPVGKLGIGISYKGPEARISNFTKDELYSLLSLWYISRSPLMIGGHLPETDVTSYELLTNEEAIQVSRNSVNNRRIALRNAKVKWAADIPGTEDRYVAFFNQWETFKPVTIGITWEELGLEEGQAYAVRDLWARKDLGIYKNQFSAPIVMHGAGLYRLSKK